MLITTSLDHGMSVAKVSAAEAARMMKKAGFDGIDLGMGYNYDPSATRPSDEAWCADIIATAEAAKNEGLVIGQCHMPSYPGHLDAPGDGDYQEFEDLMLPDYIRCLEVCGAVGCTLAVMHPFFTLDSSRGSINGNVKMLRKLMPYMEKYGVAVALENVFARRANMYVDCSAQHMEDINEIITRMDSPLVGACIDTGHANIFRYNICDMARLYGKNLLALHVNTNSGTDEHVLPNACSSWCERMDFHAFSRTLKEIGYKGTYNLEVALGKVPAGAAQSFYYFAADIARGLAAEAE